MGDFHKFQLIDVRQPGEYAKGHLPGALLIPLGELAERASELDEDKHIIVYCRSGVRSKAACQILTRLGLDKVLNMKGGISSYHGEKVEGNVRTVEKKMNELDPMLLPDLVEKEKQQELQQEPEFDGFDTEPVDPSAPQELPTRQSLPVLPPQS